MRHTGSQGTVTVRDRRRASGLLLLVALSTAGCSRTEPEPQAAESEPAVVDPPAEVGPASADLRRACRDDPSDFESCRGYVFGVLRDEPELRSFLDGLAEQAPEAWVPRYLLGIVRYAAGEVGAAREDYESAERLARRQDDAAGRAESIYALASLLLRTGGQAEGERLLVEALEISRVAGTPLLTGRVLRALANRYRDTARYFDEHALRLELAEMAAAGVAELRPPREQFLLAENLRRLGRNREARIGFELARELARREESPRYEANAAMALGVLAVDAGERGALALFEEAASVAERDPALESRAVFAEILAGLALLRSGDAELARRRLAGVLDRSAGWERLRFRNLVYLAEAERQVGDLERAEELYRRVLEPSDDAGVQESLRDALMGLAALQLAQGRSGEAISSARRAERLVESMRANIGPFSERTHFLQARASTYQLLAAALAERGRDGDLSAAFDAVERAHARTLVEVLGADAAKAHERAAGSVDRLDLASVQGRLAPGELLVEFLLGEERSSLVAVDRQSAAFYPLPARGLLEERVEAYRDVLLRPLTRLDARIAPEVDFRRFAPAGHELFVELLGPIADRLSPVERLIVVPDRRLYLLPFEALIGRAVEPERPIEFLGASLQVEYLPAAAFLARRKRRRTDGRLLLVAVGAGRPDLGLAPLGSVDDEQRSVIASYPAGRVELLRDGEATVDALLTHLQHDTAILHLATHALLDPARGPRIVLAGGGPEGAGLLDAATIAGIDRPPALVVLSACDTARGELVGGEGVLGLVRAFTLAGSSQIVATLWTVDDALSADLMGRLHAGLREGQTASRALWTARRGTLDEGFVHPFYWSGFVLYGAD